MLGQVERHFNELNRVRFSKIEEAQKLYIDGKPIEAADALDDISLSDFLKHYEEIQVKHNHPDKIKLSDKIAARLTELGIRDIKDFHVLYDTVQLAAAKAQVKLASATKDLDTRCHHLKVARRNLAVMFTEEAIGKADKIKPVVERSLDRANDARRLERA